MQHHWAKPARNSNSQRGNVRAAIFFYASYLVFPHLQHLQFHSTKQTRGQQQTTAVLNALFILDVVLSINEHTAVINNALLLQ